jgi:hypothetical protein
MNTLQADVEQTRRVSEPSASCHARPPPPCRTAKSMCSPFQPSGSLDAPAQQHLKELPAGTRHALGALGVLRGGGGAPGQLPAVRAGLCAGPDRHG